MNSTEGHDLTEIYKLLLINSVNIAGRSLSAIPVLISIVIFLTIKNLRDKGNVRIHINLFISQLLMDISFIILEVGGCVLVYNIINRKEPFEINGFTQDRNYSLEEMHDLFHENDSRQETYYSIPRINDSLQGKIDSFDFFMDTTKSYFVLSNTFWMSCEAIYLLYLIYTVWFIEDGILVIIYFIGWGIPAISIGIFTLIIISYGFNTNEENYKYYKTIFVDCPTAISVILNVLMLLIIIAYLVVGTKHFERPVTMGARAILILTPLFGIHHFFLQFLPKSYAALFINAILSSTQGIVISTIYCFKMKEVQLELQLAWRRNYFLFRNGSHLMTSSYQSSTRRTRTTSSTSTAQRSVHQF